MPTSATGGNTRSLKMALFHLKTSETVPLTLELAEEMRDMEPSPTERDLSQARVKYLQEQAGAGKLVNFNWASAELDGRTLRMNGNHSSTMLCELNGAFPRDLYVHRDHYAVDSVDGLADLFRQFDNRKSSRTVGDVAGAWQGLHPSLRTVPKTTAKLGIQGICWQRREVSGRPVPKGDDQFTLFNETSLHPFLVWLGTLFSSKTPELANTYVVGAMYATFIVNDDAAKVFWEQVARGGMEYNDSAASTLLDRWLTKAASMHGTRTARALLSRRSRLRLKTGWTQTRS
jgi:hypothetical protein